MLVTPAVVCDTQVVFQISYKVAGSLTDVAVDTCRRKHLAYLMADQGALINPDATRNLPKQVSHSPTLVGVQLMHHKF